MTVPLASLALADGAALGPAAAATLLLLALVGPPVGAFVVAWTVGHRLYRGEPLLGWLRLASIPYIQVFQRAVLEGRERIPRLVGPEGLIVVSTHGAGLDPVAIQSALPHPIRWMMSAEMMYPALGWLWRRLRIIPVAFDNRDAAALRTAIDHVRSGGVLGIFPEGSIERPARQLRPFSGGLRLILAKTRAPVLVVAIDPGTPAETAYGALLRPTRPTLRFLAVVEPGPDGHARDTSERIFGLLREATGWPVNEAPAEPADAATVDRNLRAFGMRA